jgi:hypothetical protein
MNGSDEVDLRNLYARAQFARRKRNADDDLIFDLVDFFDDDEVEEIKTRRNLGPRPGGSNQKGRPDYGSSPWAQMLRDPTLRVPGSAAGKKFGERFRAPVPVFDKLMVFVLSENIDDMFFTCVGLQNMIHLWNKETSEVTHWEVDTDFEGAGGDFADDTEGDDDARLWCRPRLRRAKGHKAGATYFDAEPTDDFSGFGKASMPCDVQRFLFSEPIGPGEKERHDVKQAKLVEHFKYACAAGVVHWLRS